MKRDCAFLDMRIEMERGTATRSSVLAQIIQGQRSLLGFRAHGVAELDRTERLHFHFSLSCIGEEKGNPLQCSCLENPRDGRSLVGCHLWGPTESDMTEAT